MKETQIEKTKPLLRGHLHQAAFFIAVGAGAMLIALAPTTEARVVALIYTLGLSLMFGVSSLYHRITWQPNARMWWRRMDHSAIFVMIAGTGTPISLLGIKGGDGLHLLWIFWGCAVAGVFKELFWIKAPKWISAILYVAMGWAGVIYYHQMSAALGPVGMGLMLAGGIVYTIGAVIYALKKPDPFPKVFGYHEIFHTLVNGAAILHFIVVYGLIANIQS